MRKKKSRSSVSSTMNKIISGMDIFWSCFFYLSIILTVSMASETITTNNSTLETSTSTAAMSGSTQEYKRSVTEAPALANVSNTMNFTATPSQGRSSRHLFVRSGNELWDGLVDDCLYKPSFSCFQKNVFLYLDKTLKLEDVNITDRILFKKIDVNASRLEAELEAENEIPAGDENEPRSETPLEEVTDALAGKFNSFMMTHNMDLKLPETFFDGATFRVTPRKFEGNGALVKVEFIPRTLVEARGHGTGRILFKKIKKFFNNKLLLAFLALVVVIKLIKIKIFWILPLIVGVTAAKKLLLKFVLFLFPALSNVFKLCSYYHKNYHETKYHHHKHQINHLHTVVPTWYKDQLDHYPGHVHHGPELPGHGHHGPELIYTSPPKGHPSEYLHGAPPPSSLQHYPSDWESSGPGLGSDLIGDIHRNSYESSFKPKVDDIKTINSWGITHGPSPPQSSSAGHANPFIKDAKQAIYATPVAAMETAIGRTPIMNNDHPMSFSSYDPSSQLKYADKYLVAEKLQHILREQQQHQQHQQHQQQHQQQQHQQQQHQQPVRYGQTEAIAANKIDVDPFYGPIVTKIDNILLQFGQLDDHCKEWLICNMYKDPSKYSPHSNFVSAELSRDSSELQKPQNVNAAVLKFYKYVKAARDGQDQKDCIAANPKCII